MGDGSLLVQESLDYFEIVLMSGQDDGGDVGGKGRVFVDLDSLCLKGHPLSKSAPRLPQD